MNAAPSMPPAATQMSWWLILRLRDATRHDPQNATSAPKTTKTLCELMASSPNENRIGRMTAECRSFL
jgi:hypothetical protein